jgi:hypothetical protein
MLSSGANVIIWDGMLSSGMKCYHLEPMLSSGTKCYHLELMLSSRANVIICYEMLSTGANVIICIYCYHLVLSCDVIIWDDNTPLFYFSWKLHSLRLCFFNEIAAACSITSGVYCRLTLLILISNIFNNSYLWPWDKSLNSDQASMLPCGQVEGCRVI